MSTPTKVSALEQLREVVRRGNFVILDTETTGLDRGEIVQIAMIDPSGKVLLDQFIRPMNGIPEDATRIHGISFTDVASCPTWAAVAPVVQTLITGKDVITYNAVYDRKMMHQSAETCGMEKIDWKAIANFYCAMEAYAEFHGDWNDYHQSYRWQKLSIAAARCGVEVKNAHNALGDCLMTLGVIRAIAG